MKNARRTSPRSLHESHAPRPHDLHCHTDGAIFRIFDSVRDVIVSGRQSVYVPPFYAEMGTRGRLSPGGGGESKVGNTVGKGVHRVHVNYT